MKNVFVKFIVLSLILLSINVISQEKKNEISVGDLAEWIANDTTIVILDVRNPEELVGELGHINGVINIPVYDLEKRIKELNDYKERKIAVICRSGNRSRYGTAILLQNGFNAYNVLGGMRAYREVIPMKTK